MKPSTALPHDNLGSLKIRYEKLAHSLTSNGLICQGTVLAREGVRNRNGVTKTYGPYYQWTRKLNGKTISIAVSEEQFGALQTAISNQRRLEKILAEMQEISEEIILKTIKGIKSAVMFRRAMFVQSRATDCDPTYAKIAPQTQQPAPDPRSCHNL